MDALGLLVLLASVLLIIITARSFYLSSKYGELEARLKVLERRSAGAQEPKQLPVTATQMPQAVPTATSVPPAPSRTREEWEALIGGKLLNRIGALALIIGVGFFLKYAFDNNWISETTRVLTGAVIGFLCLIGARRTQKKGFQIFSQGIAGAGIAILYLSVYACFNYYQLVSQPVAFVLMAAVTVIAFFEALRYDSLAVSVLACVGGFLTPFMLSTGESNPAELFTYVAVLDIGVLLVLLRKHSWFVLEPMLLAGTFILYFSWFDVYYTRPDTLLTLIFLVLFWAIFHGFDMFRGARGIAGDTALRRVVAWFHAGLFWIALSILLEPHFHAQMGLAAAVASALYAVSTIPVERRRPGAYGALIQYSLTAAAFLLFAIAIEFESFTIVIFWTVEAVVLVWAGTRYQRRYLWVAGLLLFGVTVITLLSLEGSLVASPLEGFQLLLNQRTLAYIFLALSLGACVIFLRDVVGTSITGLVELLHYGWVFLLFVLLTVETNDLFRSWMVNAGGLNKDALGFNRFMVMAGVWSLYALALAGAGTRPYTRPVIFSGISVVLIAACLTGIRGIAFAPLAEFIPVFNIRVLALVLTVVVMFLVVRRLGRTVGRSAWIPEIREAMQIIGVLLLLVLFTGEIRDIFEKAILGISAGMGLPDVSAEGKRLENLKQISLSGLWLTFSICLMVFGIWRRMRMLRLLAMALFGFTILKIFIYDLSFLETLYRIFSFMALGLILLAVSYLYQRYRAIILEPSAGDTV